MSTHITPDRSPDSDVHRPIHNTTTRPGAPLAIAPPEAMWTLRSMSNHNTPDRSPDSDVHRPIHDTTTCPGCDRILSIDDLVVTLGEPAQTLYKRSRCGYPSFPRRLRDRRQIAVLCRHAKAYLAEVSK